MPLKTIKEKIEQITCSHDWVELEHDLATGMWKERECSECGKHEERPVSVR